jgi:hypothetical protein
MELMKISWELYFSTNDCAQSFGEFDAEYSALKNRYHPFVWFIINAIEHIKYKKGELK